PSRKARSPTITATPRASSASTRCGCARWRSAGRSSSYRPGRGGVVARIERQRNAGEPRCAARLPRMSRSLSSGRASRGPGGSIRATGGYWSPLSGHAIGPQGLDLVGREEVAPGRHLVLAAGHRVDETVVLVGRKFPQVEGGAGVTHVRAVARRAVDLVKLGAGRDPLPRKVFLSRRRRADRE